MITMAPMIVVPTVFVVLAGIGVLVVLGVLLSTLLTSTLVCTDVLGRVLGPLRFWGVRAIVAHTHIPFLIPRTGIRCRRWSPAVRVG